MSSAVPARRWRHAAGATAAAVVLGALAAAPASAAPSTVAPASNPKSIVYVEVNDNDFANVADYTLADSGAAVFDMAAIFAANINYDGTAAYLSLNPRVTETLENADTQIRPVQARGTKVLLSILGNHQGAGFANFTSYEAADAFAAQVQAAVQKYGLDGVDLDDEWSEYGVNGTPQPNASSFIYLLQALRARLGSDKLITFYNIGPSASYTSFGGVDAGSLLDYAWNPYYGAWLPPTIPGMSTDRLGAAAIDLTATSATTVTTLAQRTLDQQYGVFVAYNLIGGDQSAKVSQLTQTLYGQAAAYKAAPRDTTAPTATVVAGSKNTLANADGTYKRVSFSFADEGLLADATLNGVVTDLGRLATGGLDRVKPGVAGAVLGANTLVVHDMAGNATTVEFVLTK